MDDYAVVAVAFKLLAVCQIDQTNSVFGFRGVEAHEKQVGLESVLNGIVGETDAGSGLNVLERNRGFDFTGGGFL